MHTIATVGDKTSHMGTVITGSNTRYVKGKPVARLGDTCTCPKHGMTKIVQVLNIMPMTDGRPTAHSGAITACGAKIIQAPHQNSQGTAT
jgi:uncharacterized Zn-binding protein involved in type VI secretion